MTNKGWEGAGWRDLGLTLAWGHPWLITDNSEVDKTLNKLAHSDIHRHNLLLNLQILRKL